MNAGPNSNKIRHNFSLKRHLISLNHDLDDVLSKIDNKQFDGIFYFHSHRQNLGSLSNLQKSVLFLEDRRFLAHHGFEFRAPLRLLKRIFKKKRMGAVSTIDQQLVRICTNRYERTLKRKIRETVLAFLINCHRSKSAIFYTYLHDSYFGYKLEGCEITSRFLFSKPAIELSVAEASFIASLLARPLPKIVYQSIEYGKDIREITPEYIIHIGTLANLDWADHISNRYQYALRMAPSIPRSLRIR